RSVVLRRTRHGPLSRGLEAFEIGAHHRDLIPHTVTDAAPHASAAVAHGAGKRQWGGCITRGDARETVRPAMARAPVATAIRIPVAADGVGRAAGAGAGRIALGRAPSRRPPRRDR